MANFTLLLSLLCFISLISSFNLGGIMGQDVPTFSQTWCVAKASANEVELGNNIEYACNQIGVDCSIIQEGGPCYYPTNLINHASVVMNLYYQKAGRAAFNCDFSNSAVVVVTDPSYGSCLYAFI
ncbi:major pollen allergen Ole e 10-like isoform X2 [Spinacia oleracea]|uniref:Major pollen allergen Ole e 10-like isoform X2 n=1 Tax=Spinacia oleracea TaxID=3562 RepID=A0ABM3QN18_SPIOL|nr:major pollen allergen Ole e 10-like isoform X2 [Spinacia oleracea]